MRYKKILLGIIASVLCLGLLNGCSGYSHDFNSSEEAQKYVLAKLKDKYNEEFIITEVKKYKEEKIGLNWIMAEVSNKENSFLTIPFCRCCMSLNFKLIISYKRLILK